MTDVEKELNAWRELGEEMGRVVSLMPTEVFEDWFPDWFGPRLFDLQVTGASDRAVKEPNQSKLRAALEKVLRSAVPNPKEHPTMFAAWAEARALIARLDEFHGSGSAK